jgi:hypothetical protein
MSACQAAVAVVVPIVMYGNVELPADRDQRMLQVFVRLGVSDWCARKRGWFRCLHDDLLLVRASKLFYVNIYLHFKKILFI